MAGRRQLHDVCRSTSSAADRRTSQDGFAGVSWTSQDGFAGIPREDNSAGAAYARRLQVDVVGRSAASARRLQGERQGDGSPSSRKAGRRIVAASLNVAGWFRRAASQDGAAGRRRRVRRRKVGRRKAGQTLDLPSRFALIPCGRETPRERGRRRLGF